MKKKAYFTWSNFVAFLLISLKSHAQVTGFENLLPYEENTLSTYATFCREASDGGFILYPGISNVILKLSPTGEVIGETSYNIDGNFDGGETRIVGLIEIPDVPDRCLVVAEYADSENERGNLFHLVELDDQLSFNLASVRVVNLSGDAKFVNAISWKKMPHFNLEPDGSVSFAAPAYNWDNAFGLLFVRVEPNGNMTTKFNEDIFADCTWEADARYFEPVGDHYEMIVNHHNQVSNDLVYHTVSRDFENVEYTVCLKNDTIMLGLLQINEPHCEGYAIAFQEDRTAPVRLDDGALLLPTRLYANDPTSGFIPNLDRGLAIWKLSNDFQILNCAVLDWHNGYSEELSTLYPIQVMNDGVFLCYQSSENGACPQVVICKLDMGLNLVWQRRYGGELQNHFPSSFVPTRDGGCFISGMGNENLGSANMAPYVIKINSDGYTTATGAKELLLKPYYFHSNPVGDALTLVFSPDVTPALVELYDLQGRRVLTQTKALDRISMEGLPSGTYLVRVTMDDGSSFSDKVVKK